MFTKKITSQPQLVFLLGLLVGALLTLAVLAAHNTADLQDVVIKAPVTKQSQVIKKPAAPTVKAKTPTPTTQRGSATPPPTTPAQGGSSGNPRGIIDSGM